MQPPTSPSDSGPPRCRHRLSTAWYAPLMLKRPTQRSFTVTRRPLPGGISPLRATVTNSAIKIRILMGPLLQRDADVLRSFLEDAAHFPGGHAAALATPESEADVVAIVKDATRVLPIGAPSSLNGGAPPMGDVLIATSRMNRILEIGSDRVCVQPGVTLTDLDAVLQRAGKYYPPVPTFMGAFVGGVVATNAAGAATFRYGTTRDWVLGLRIVLASGDILTIERGAIRARAGALDVPLGSRTIRVPVPTYRMPNVPKISAGYFASPDMDLVDLFVGSEGTLGIVVEATLRVLPERPAICLAFIPVQRRDTALALVDALRQDRHVSAIEHMDARCLELLREDGADRQFGVTIPDGTAIALLITLELPAGTTSEQAFEQIGRFRELDAPLAQFCRSLERAGLIDAVEIAVPGDSARAAQLLGVREAVPAAVNARVGRAKLTIDGEIAKTAADMIVPFAHLGALVQLYDDEFA